MKINGLLILEKFSEKHADIKSRLQTWVNEVSESDWSKPDDILKEYNHTSFLSGNRVIFNIKGNKYRLLTKVNYKNKIVLVKEIGTHAEYNKWNL